MSSMAVDGLVSGLDTANLIKQLMQVEAIPKQRLQISANQQASDIKALQSLSTVLKKLADAATAVAKPQTWSASTAATTGDAATAVARAGAPAGSYGLVVDRLASASTWTTDAAYALDAVVVPSKAIDVTRADGTAVTLQPASGSLRDVMSAINSADGLGLRAVAVRVGADSYRLQVTSTTTGADQGQLALSGFGADVPVTATAGRDAVFTVDGMAATSASNRIADLVPGLDVTLTRPGTATVAVTADSAATGDSVAALVTAANEALAEITKQTAAGTPGVDGAAATGRGALTGDTMVRALSGRIVQAVTDALGGTSAASIGIQSTRDGTLVLDRARLDAALAADPAKVRALVSPSGGGTGVAGRLTAVVDSATDAATGFLTSAIQGRERTKKDLETQIVSWERRLELRQSSLQRQFSGLEVALGKLQSQGSWLSGQLAGLQGQRS